MIKSSAVNPGLFSLANQHLYGDSQRDDLV